MTSAAIRILLACLVLWPSPALAQEGTGSGAPPPGGTGAAEGTGLPPLPTAQQVMDHFDDLYRADSSFAGRTTGADALGGCPAAPGGRGARRRDRSSRRTQGAHPIPPRTSTHRPGLRGRRRPCSRSRSPAA